MEKVKPCPKCKSVQVACDCDLRGNWIVCWGCNCKGPKVGSVADAIAAWNALQKEVNHE